MLQLRTERLAQTSAANLRQRPASLDDELRPACRLGAEVALQRQGVALRRVPVRLGEACFDGVPIEPEVVVAHATAIENGLALAQRFVPAAGIGAGEGHGAKDERTEEPGARLAGDEPTALQQLGGACPIAGVQADARDDV